MIDYLRVNEKVKVWVEGAADIGERSRAGAHRRRRPRGTRSSSQEVSGSDPSRLEAQCLVESKKGKGGGYFLRRKPSEITFAEVIRVLDGPLAAVSCVSQTAYMPCAECLDEQSCGVRLAMKKVRDATARNSGSHHFGGCERAARAQARRSAADHVKRRAP